LFCSVSFVFRERESKEQRAKSKESVVMQFP
jgi:hypothetical protein